MGVHPDHQARDCNPFTSLTSEALRPGSSSETPLATAVD